MAGDPPAPSHGAIPETINSMTHPRAYAFLHRSCKEGKNIVPQEIVDDWLAGGARKNKLLQTFVRKIYVDGGSQDVNCLRLDAYVKIKQVSDQGLVDQHEGLCLAHGGRAWRKWSQVVSVTWLVLIF